MEVKRICNKCGELNKINEQSIKTKDCYDGNKKYYRFVYFRCDRCNECNVLQIDTMKTLDICKKANNILFKTIKNKRNMNDIEISKYRKEFDKTNKKLDEQRNRLKELSKGKNFYDEDGNIFIKGLTFGEDGGIIDNNL